MTAPDAPPESGAFPALRWERLSGGMCRHLEAYAGTECIGCVYAERWDGAFPWRMEAGCGPDGRADTVDSAKVALEAEWQARCARTGLLRMAASPPEPGANPLDTPEMRDLIAAGPAGMENAMTSGQIAALEAVRAYRAARKGANPLDMPEAREAVFESMMRVVEAWPEVPEDAEEEDAAKRQMTGAVVDGLAPHVVALQRAAFRACVEAAGEACDEMAAANDALAVSEPIAAVSGQFADAAEVARACAEAVRQVPTPAAFAAPAPPSPIAGRPTDADLLWLCQHPRHSLAMVEIEGGFVPLIVDLFAGTVMRVPVREQIRCVEREVRLRRSAYVRWVASGRMKQAQADREIAAMEAVLDTLREVEAGAADEPAEVHDAR